MNKEQAVIFDLDGTLALNTGRDPYDWTKVEQDIVNQPIAMLYNMFNVDPQITIFFATARSEEAYEPTTAWLEKNLQVNWDKHVLLMRETKDFRPDNEVKKDFYSKYIEPDYDVLMVFEDHDRVVDMYRSLGLTCLQVGDRKEVVK